MALLQAVWMRFIKPLRRLQSFDERQCNESCGSYDDPHKQVTRGDALSSPSDETEPRAVIDYRRADHARIGQALRDRYDGFAQEELPREILETLADLNQRLNRRDGD